MAAIVLARERDCAHPAMIPPERETIVALASGRPPCAIAVVRISGPKAFAAATALIGELPPMRRAALRAIRATGDGLLIDRALVLCFGGPASATGEDVVELQLHGSTAVIAATIDALTALPDVRLAEAGEFTRRALLNGRIDLPQAEALGDLLAATGERQRAQAVRGLEGALGRSVAAWRGALIELLSEIEGELDFPDEAAEVVSSDIEAGLVEICDALGRELAGARITERVRDGVTIVLRGAPNVGKSSLLNAVAGREVAIVAASPGTTRDPVHVDLMLAGIPVRMTDTAGIRPTDDPVELAGIARAERSASAADLVLTVFDQVSLEASIVTKIDISGAQPGIRGETIFVSARTGAGIDDLLGWLERWVTTATTLREPTVSTSARQRALIGECDRLLRAASQERDRVLQAELIRFGLQLLDRLLHANHEAAVIDGVFARLCIGK